MTSFIDTHCHLDKLDSTPEETVKEAKQEGVERMITISVNEESLISVDLSLIFVLISFSCVSMTWSLIKSDEEISVAGSDVTSLSSFNAFAPSVTGVDMEELEKLNDCAEARLEKSE